VQVAQPRVVVLSGVVPSATVTGDKIFSGLPRAVDHIDGKRYRRGSCAKDAAVGLALAEVGRARRAATCALVADAGRDGERVSVYPWADDPSEQERFVLHVVSIFEKEGGDAWYARPAEDFLPPGARRRDFDGFEKETDILDVWFDSGVSHIAVLRSGAWPDVADRGEPPADVYLEGHDQHRGWFQSSLLTSVALFGGPPYRQVVTHGFVVDGAGRKMSKSLGNVIAPQDLLKRYGADIVRLWVASLDYRNDVPISEEILSRCGEAYRKIRNTARFLLSNLYDFDPGAHAVPFSSLHPLDSWALTQTRRLVDRLLQAYESYEFHSVNQAVVNFCATALSSFYLDIVKDRIYASAPDSPERRSAQTAFDRIARVVATLTAPVLPFTSEEIWAAIPGSKEESVHLAGFERLTDISATLASQEAWDRLTQLREEAAALLEEARREKRIGSSLEGAILLSAHEGLDRDRDVLGTEASSLADLFIVSEVGRGEPDGSSGWKESRTYEGLWMKFRPASGRRCDRCWKVTAEAQGNGLCARCRRVLSVLPPVPAGAGV